MSDQRAIVKATFAIIEAALHLPDGHRVAGLRITDTFSETFEILIEGPSLPAREPNEFTARGTIQFTQTDDASQMVPSRTIVGQFIEETKR